MSSDLWSILQAKAKSERLPSVVDAFFRAGGWDQFRAIFSNNGEWNVKTLLMGNNGSILSQYVFAKYWANWLKTLLRSLVARVMDDWTGDSPHEIVSGTIKWNKERLKTFIIQLSIDVWVKLSAITSFGALFDSYYFRKESREKSGKGKIMLIHKARMQLGVHQKTARAWKRRFWMFADKVCAAVVKTSTVPWPHHRTKRCLSVFTHNLQCFFCLLNGAVPSFGQKSSGSFNLNIF